MIVAAAIDQEYVKCTQEVIIVSVVVGVVSIWPRFMGGCSNARYNLGVFEHSAGNKERALRHYMIAVESGHNGSLKQIQELYSEGKATKDEYTKALRAYQKYLGEVKSAQRDEAAAAFEGFKYYA